MSRSKNRDHVGFQVALTAATASSPPVPPESEPGPLDTKRRRGRPFVGNEQITLRLAPGIREKLVERVAAELSRTGRVVTLQTIINRILEKELNG
jgi:hypothetical protein